MYTGETRRQREVMSEVAGATLEVALEINIREGFGDSPLSGTFYAKFFGQGLTAELLSMLEGQQGITVDLSRLTEARRGNYYDAECINRLTRELILGIGFEDFQDKPRITRRDGPALIVPHMRLPVSAELWTIPVRGRRYLTGFQI